MQNTRHSISTSSSSSSTAKCVPQKKIIYFYTILMSEPVVVCCLRNELHFILSFCPFSFLFCWHPHSSGFSVVSSRCTLYRSNRMVESQSVLIKWIKYSLDSVGHKLIIRCSVSGNKMEKHKNTGFSRVRWVSGQIVEILQR